MSADCVVRDRDGNVIQRSRNLAGIRRYVGQHLIKTLAIDAMIGGAWEGRLLILFDDGSSYETDFAAWCILKDFVRRWRNVHGATLAVNGVARGPVSWENPALAD